MIYQRCFEHHVHGAGCYGDTEEDARSQRELALRYPNPDRAAAMKAISALEACAEPSREVVARIAEDLRAAIGLKPGEVQGWIAQWRSR